MKIKENISLKPFNTFGIDVRARYFAEIKSNEDIIRALAFAKNIKKKILILGGGSNVLFTEDLDALVLKINISGIRKLASKGENVLTEAGSGVLWHDFVLYSLKNGLSGIENLSLIPGTVGAAPMQNIGAYGVELKSVFHSLEAIEIKTGRSKTFLPPEIAFGYRESIFKTQLKGKYIIYKVLFNLSKIHQPNISYGDIKMVLEKGNLGISARNISEAVISIRRSKLPDPAKIGNAGSFFKNPVIPANAFDRLKQEFKTIPGYPNDECVKVPAAWLIENIGWKGRRLGQVGVHDKQPLVLVNYGNGKGKDILNLSLQIQQEVLEKFNIVLEREVNVIQSDNLIHV
jgi:UDP-N-acetylmuramate dehydrogenase